MSQTRDGHTVRAWLTAEAESTMMDDLPVMLEAMIADQVKALETNGCTVRRFFSFDISNPEVHFDEYYQNSMDGSARFSYTHAYFTAKYTQQVEIWQPTRAKQEEELLRKETTDEA